MRAHSYKPNQKYEHSRLTVEDLKTIIPLFNLGIEAEALLENPKGLTINEINKLDNQVRLKKLATDKICGLAAPLITRELNKLIKSSHLRNKIELFDLLYYAGVNGMIKGLYHFDLKKMDKSSTNYLFQWLTTYARKELNRLETPAGVAPSRFQKYKKISAVRKKMTEELGEVSNEDILEYFHSGKAEIENFSGPLKKKKGVSQANLDITLSLILEQEEYEKRMGNDTLVDLSDSINAEKFSERDSTPFFETVFGIFVNSYNFTETAKVVLISDLSVKDITPEQEKLLASLEISDYRNISNRWKDLLKDIEGPFYSFLLSLKGQDFQEFDISSTIKNIEEYDKSFNKMKYMILFEDRKAKKIG